jgi:hypothetical protein
MRNTQWFRIGFRFRKWLTGAIFGGVLLLLSFAILLKDGVVGPSRNGWPSRWPRAAL